jgi:hypothetical protein
MAGFRDRLGRLLRTATIPGLGPQMLGVTPPPRKDLPMRRERWRASIVLTSAAVLLVTSGAPAPPATTLPELNEKVLAFARAKLGQSVGDGSCATLAIAALGAAGARCYPSAEPDGALVWGRTVASFKEALPGDILQFHNAIFQGKKAITKRRWISWHHEYPRHTAIVSRVSEGGNLIAVLHQNVIMKDKDKDKSKGKDKVKENETDAEDVQEGEIRIDSLLKGGWVRIYRPVAAPAPGRFVPSPTPDADRDGPSEVPASGDEPRR